MAKLKPNYIRDQSIKPSDEIIAKVLEHHQAVRPLNFVMSVVLSMGYPTIRDYDQAATRAERFIRNNPTKRMPTHIRNKAILKRVIERCLGDVRFGNNA